MNDQRIRLVTDQAEADELGIRVGDHVRVPDPEPVFVPFGDTVNPRSLGEPEPEPIKGTIEFSDRELDAATLAYVATRYPVGAEEWRKRFPAAWLETRVRIHAALLAAAAVRS
jgi:hypothetical protein